jgi:hypothetical protein
MVEAQSKASRIRSSFFKYYIHDGVERLRLQLLGELSEFEVTELGGCWQTARTILGNRQLILDLRGLKAVDDAGKQWVASMVQEGAMCVPEDFLRSALAGGASEGQSEPLAVKLSLLGRLLGLFRGPGVAAAD